MSLFLLDVATDWPKLSKIGMPFYILSFLSSQNIKIHNKEIIGHTSNM